MKYIILVIASVALSIGIYIYRYHDCKKVGHTTFYCLTSE